MADVYEKISKAQPDLAESAAKIKDTAEKKLFHQLIATAFPLLQKINDGSVAIELFEKEIKPIGDKLNPVMYMEIIGVLLKKFLSQKTCEEKLSFITDNFAPFDVIPDEDVDSSSSSTGGKDKDGDTKMGGASRSNNKKTAAVGSLSHYSRASESDFKDAKALFLSFKGQVLVEHKQLEDAKDVMDVLESQLFQKRNVVSIVPKVFSWFYAAQLRLYHATQKSSQYYRAGINYLLYTPLELATEEFDLKDLAVNLGIASLVAPGEYNFGELLDSSLYKHADVQNSIWIYDVIFAFQEGRYDLYDSAMKKHAGEVGKVQILKDNEKLIYEKFCSSVLMEYAFQQPKNKRTISLRELAQHIRVDDVETLLINAMCADLIRGTIDEVAGTFAYTWVKPRVLDMGRLKTLEQRVGSWIDAQGEVLQQVEEMIPELAVTV